MSLLQAKYISLRTYRKSGVAVDTPVWFVSTSESVHYVFSADNAGKVKRLRNSANAQIATCDMTGGSVGEWRDCQSYLIEDESQIQQAHDLFIEKYGVTMRITDFLSRIAGRLNKRAYIKIEL